MSRPRKRCRRHTAAAGLGARGARRERARAGATRGVRALASTAWAEESDAAPRFRVPSEPPLAEPPLAPCCARVVGRGKTRRQERRKVSCGPRFLALRRLRPPG